MESARVRGALPKRHQPWVPVPLGEERLTSSSSGRGLMGLLLLGGPGFNDLRRIVGAEVEANLTGSNQRHHRR